MKKYYLGAAILLLLVIGIVIVTSDGAAKVEPARDQKLYVALGDSVAAGVGLRGDSDASACNRTNQAYPNVVARQLGYKLHNLACSGATLTAGMLGRQDVNQLLVTPQLNQLLDGPKPNLVTVTIGANDVDWTTILAKCYSGECGSATDTATVATKLQTVANNLQAMLSQIQNHYASDPPQVILTGYHQVFAATAGQCTDLTGIDSNELAWGRQLQTSISDTIKSAVSGYSFAKYVGVDFSGHELCSPDPWVQGLSDKQPYHPTAAGQAAFAKQIITQLRSDK